MLNTLLLGRRERPYSSTREERPPPAPPRLAAQGPNLKAGLIASGALLLLLLALFHATSVAAQSGTASFDNINPIVGVLRLLFALPLVLLFGSLVALRRHIPRAIVSGLGLTVIGLSARLSFEAASNLYGEVRHNEWLELGLSASVLSGVLVYLGFMLRQRKLALQASERDPLTSLLNRQGFVQRYQALPAGTPVTLAMLDMNDLKRINDVMGHGAGDAYLQKVAKALGQRLPDAYALARWGGDEFALLLPGGAADARNTLGQIASSARDTPSALPAFAVGAAEGVAGDPFARTLALADADMYASKEAQRVKETRTASHTSLEGFSERLERLDAPGAVVEEGLAMARELLGFETAFFASLEGASLRPETVVGETASEVTRLLASGRYGPATGIVGQAITSRQTTWADDYPAHPAVLPEWAAVGLKSMVATPVMHRGDLVGLLCLMNFGTWRPITPQARRVLDAVALRLGHALERAASLAELRGTLEGSLMTLGVALEARDLETSGHTERVVALSGRLGRALGLNEAQLTELRYGAYLHDTGKLAVPDAILLKPGKLEPEEWAVMKTHSQKGFEIAQRIPALNRGALEVVRHHHERWDDKGYPDGLSGEDIPLLARIFAVCDVYDALTSERPYKAPWTPEAALSEIRAQAGKQFDPRVARTFADLLATHLPGADAQHRQSECSLCARPAPQVFS